MGKATLDCHVHPAGIDRQFSNIAKGHNALIAWTGSGRSSGSPIRATGTYHRAPEVALAYLPCVKLNPERAALRPGNWHTGQDRPHRCEAASPDGRRAATGRRSARNAQQNQLTELVNARVARQSGKWKGKSFIRGGRS